MKRFSLVVAIFAIAAASQSLADEPATFSEKIRDYQTHVAANFARAGMPICAAASTGESEHALVRASFERAGMPAPRASVAGQPTRQAPASDYFGLVLDSFGRVMPAAGIDRIAFRTISDR